VSSKPRDGPPKTAPRPSKSLYSVVSSAAYAAKTSATQQQDTWQLQLHRLATGLSEKESSNESLERCERLKRRFEALNESVKLCQAKLRRVGDEVALQDRVESQLAQEETAWEQQMQTREERVAEREVELQALQEESAQDQSEQDHDEDEEQDQDEELQAEMAELQEAVALRAEEKRDIEAAIDSLQRKKARARAAKAEERKKQEQEEEDVEADAAAAAREQVLNELREEKESLQREIIAAEELEEKLDENVDLPALKDELTRAKSERTRVQAKVDSLRLELARRKRKMRHMVDVQLLTARDTSPPTLREEAVLLHLLYEHEGEMGVNELKQEASAVLQAHGKPNGSGVVIRALYSLVANGVVQIDRSYGNGLVTSLLV